MLMPMENVFCMSALIMLLMIQLFSSFGSLSGMELPLELLHESVNGGKAMDFAHRMAFPLANSDNSVELPPNVEGDVNLNAAKGFGTTDIRNNADLEDDDSSAKSEMPKWLQMQQQPELAHHQHANYAHANMLPKHLQHHDSRPVHSATPALSPLRRCSIEISSKIPGICQAMGSIGNACVSGDYIDVFNAECL